MVARISTGKSIRKLLNYNENKVKHQQAEIITASGFLKDYVDLNFYEKERHFHKLISLNERAQTNTIHISLNFDPRENPDNNKMIAIAKNYMGKIGFGEQPYLVYRHYDAGHPHIHIVSTNIRPDGSRIPTHNLGRNESEKARQEIEKEFRLIPAESKSVNNLKLSPIDHRKITGSKSTKAAISNVLGIVVHQYRYRTLAELNAVLKLYNVSATKSAAENAPYQHKGLVYQVLDKDGNKNSKPIKASLFYMKPTLANLEKRFEENGRLAAPFARNLRTTIDYALRKNNGAGVAGLVTDLRRERISVVLRQNKDGLIYGVTYVDHRSKTVFNGSDLGKPYAAKGIMERLDSSTSLQQQEHKRPILYNQRHESFVDPTPPLGVQPAWSSLLDTITSSENTFNYVPYQLKKNQKRKKKRYLGQ